jgi:hypothetical protein
MNLNNENNMVYVVKGEYADGRDTVSSVKVFVNRENAVTYGESLVSNDSFDYYEIVETEIN